MSALALALVATICTPLVLAAMLAAPAARGLGWRFVPFAPLPALALALFADLSGAGGAGGLTEPVTGAWLGLGAVFQLDAAARLFLIASATVWTAAAAAARSSMARDPHATGFGLCFLLAMTGNLGLFLAADAASFYAFFALMSFAAYGLVLHARKPEALRAARLYIAFVVAGELALFAGFALAVFETGSYVLANLRQTELSVAAVVLMLAGFGVKMGVMPLHFWLPPAHGAAPAPASAVLSGAMIKAGLFGIIAAVPLGTAAYADTGVVVTVAGLVTLFTALALGAREASPKAVLGYSSVSQMGIVACGIGVALMAPGTWAAILPVLVFLAAHHTLAKGALFLGAGAFSACTGPRGAHAVAVALTVPALILAGLPGFSGALGKEALKAAFAEGGPVVWLPWLTLALTLSGVVTTLLMARFAVQLWRNRPAAPAGTEPEALVVPFAALSLAALALPVLWPALAGPIAAGPILDARAGAVWPIAAGLLVAVGAAVDAHTRRVGWGVFLAGLSTPVERAVYRAEQAAARSSARAGRRMRRIPPALETWLGARRLGQTGIAAMLVAVLIFEVGPGLRGTQPVESAPGPAAAAAAPGAPFQPTQ